MAIRIDRIKVNRGGPLEKDFQLEPGDVNLIYGHNETGKTYIVESIVNLLFRTGRRSTIEWNLRGWDFSGRIVVSGLQDEPVAFARTGKKLDDYWEEGIGLPQDFSRLLVVKGGETLLAHEDDGVGRNILKNYLSGEGLLDKIERQIPSTLQNANVQDGQISGSNVGQLKTRDQLTSELKRVDSLLKDAEDGYASGEVYYLTQEEERINAELETMGSAKRHHAALLHRRRKVLCQQRDGLPREEKLSEIESEIALYDSKKTEVADRSNTLTNLKGIAENFAWAEKAFGVYREIMSGKAIAGPTPIYMAFALVFIVGAVVTGLLSLSIPLAICAAGSIVFFLLYYVGTRRTLATVGNSKELEKLKAEFKTRYGSELTDRAVLDARVEKLKEDYFRANNLRKELEEELIPEMKAKQNSIRVTLKQFTGNEIPPQQWRPVVSELRSKLKILGDEISLLDVELASLAVPEEDFLDQDPGIEWDPECYKTMEGNYDDTTEDLDKELRKLEWLKNRIEQETRLENAEWEELITALRDKREEIAQEDRLMTAEILAKIQVGTVIQKFREEENTRIASGLESELLTNPLYAITGCYRSIRHEVDNGLVLTTDEDEEYPLAAVSTGAQEQAFLAMRIGFSSIIMKGQTAFLILDDAFQHSDWPRRTNLLDQVIRLVKGGWQVFYFTMDDHIRDLFLKAGEKMGDRFKSVELC